MPTNKPEYSTTYSRLWRERNPESVTIRNCRTRAAEEGVPFSITKRDIIPIRKTCACCKAKMTRGGPWKRQPSLDRIVPALGYVPGNVAWICRRCNQVKGNATLREMRRVVSYMERLS